MIGRLATWALGRFGAPIAMQAALVACAALLALLVASSAANWLIWKSRDAALERAARAEGAHQRAVADAKACAAGVARVREEEAKRRAAVEKARKAAEQRAKKAEEKAQRTMQTRPAVPGDACKSAEALARQWLQERRASGAKP